MDGYEGKMPKGLSFLGLYRRAEEEDINIDEWEQFIKEQLQMAKGEDMW